MPLKYAESVMSLYNASLYHHMYTIYSQQLPFLQLDVDLPFLAIYRYICIDVDGHQSKNHFQFVSHNTLCIPDTHKVYHRLEPEVLLERYL